MPDKTVNLFTKKPAKVKAIVYYRKTPISMALFNSLNHTEQMALDNYLTQRQPLVYATCIHPSSGRAYIQAGRPKA